MTRPPRTDEELKRSSKHLLYEVGMLMDLAHQLVSGKLEKGSTLHNASVEAFVIHVRNVMDFLYPPKSLKPDDVVAEDFLLGWESIRPDITATLDRARQRAGKEIAHLTYARLAVTPETKPWPLVEITRDISSALHPFLQNVPKEKLHEDWAGF